MGKPTVELKFCKLDLPEEGFKLTSGQSLKEITVAYEEYGTLAADKKNAIYICHALTGDPHAAFYNSEDDKQPGWWDPMIGPGKPIDTEKYYAVCSNILGGCNGTTGPSSINPDTNEPFGTSFPMVTIKDVVNVQKLFLDQLGIPDLYCVIGGSMGGMQALEWSIEYPEYVHRCVCIASAISLTSQALAFDVIGRQEIESDPDWHDGNYLEKESKPVKGLSRARQIGHVTYLSSSSMDAKFGRELQEDKRTEQPGKFSTDFQVESYLNYQGKKFVDRFDANSYLYISRMMDMFDLAREHGSIEDAFKETHCHFLIVSISTDWLFPPSQQLDIVSALISNRKSVSYFQLDSQYGHDAFLIEYDTLGVGVDAFLNDQDVELNQNAIDELEFEQISSLIDDEIHLLDVGSGDGEVMRTLRNRKNVSGICLDLDFYKIVECMRKGLPAIQLDVDTGLGIIADDTFDCVLLNETIQQLRSALHAIKQIIRISDNGVISFPNFAYYAFRLSLFFTGKLPISRSLPFEWYNTPNIHLVTVKDFQDLCERHNINIEEINFLSDGLIGRMLIVLGLTNLGSERSIVRISRPEK